MLKLKHLFNNDDLATMIVKNWITTNEMPPLFKNFRISANAVYPFKINDDVCYLRFTPEEKTTDRQILAELEYLRYLSTTKYSVVEVVPSKSGNELETVNTPWGSYYATVFKRVEGKQLSEVTPTKDIVFKWGKNLGQLHRLSNEYDHPQYKRRSYKDQFSWMKEVLSEFSDEVKAKEEIELLEHFFSQLNKTDDQFGLIHFDFEPDNVFYDDNNGVFTPIDFDDCVYHWYVMDIERSLNSIKEEFSDYDVKRLSEEFLKGYKSEKEISTDFLTLMPIFSRYANLYGYIRVLNSTKEKWSNEPEWMMGLRQYLNQLMKKRSKSFGKAINN